MARKTITQAGRDAAEAGFLDLMGEDKSLYNKPVKFKNLVDTLEYLGAKYADEIRKAIKDKDVISSGKMADSVEPLEVEVMGSVYTVSIQAAKYLSYVDEGVDGWAKSRGSRFKFKKPGKRPKRDGSKSPLSPMQKSILDYLVREGNMSRNMKYAAVTKREGKQKNIRNVTERMAITAAYMIKRQGIKPQRFMKLADTRMKKIVEKEFAKTLKVEIINNITQ